jgi:hypothetical protein
MTISEFPPNLVTTFSVDIGTDGGELTRLSNGSWLINGKPVGWREAQVWIWRWHSLRDRLASPCECQVCDWCRSEVKRLCRRHP